MKYRPEIDGLRALAVLPVVLYHAGLPWLPGGFMGVDVFFVISGYLITKIIWGGLDAGTFRIARFYERRFRRIVPALLAVVLAVLVLAVWVALPTQVVETNKSAAATLLSVSNFWFWTQSGYFAPAVELMPLLHTWSLAVEEQFYLVFPLVLMAAKALRLDARKLLLWSLPVLFLLALYLSHQKPAVAFYLLPARAWELALGALLGVGAVPAIRSPRVASLLVYGGLMMLAMAYGFGHSGMLFPGYVSLLPCVGTGLIIHAARTSEGAGRVLAWRPLVAVGLISYSLYLWHWPMLVFARMATASLTLTPYVAVGAIAASMLAAFLSWRFVERPFRARSMPLPRALSYAGAATVLVGALIVVGLWTGGFPGRLSSAATQAIAVQDDVDPLRDACMGVGKSGACRFGGEGAATFVVVGDSHAAALRPATEQITYLKGMRGELWWHGACAFLLGVRTVPAYGSDTCTAFKNKAIATLERRNDVDIVILSGRWPPYLLGRNPGQGGRSRTFLIPDSGIAEPTAETTVALFETSLTRTVRRLVASGKRVVIVGSVPEPAFDVPVMTALAKLNGVSSGASLPRVEVEERNREVDKILARVASRSPGVSYVRIWDSFCDGNHCFVQHDGKPAYSDDDHLSYGFAKTKMAQTLSERWPLE